MQHNDKSFCLSIANYFLNKKLDMRKFTTVLLVFLLSAVQLFAQNRTISGKITDEKGAGIANVSVKATGSSKGAITGADGTFTLSVAANAKQLIITGIGYATQTVSIPSSGTLNVKMSAKTDVVEDVVVYTGLTAVKKSTYTGASSAVVSRDLNEKTYGSFDQALQGRIPGGLSLSSSGAPGTSSSLILRGTSSISGTSDPLYVVDGIRVEANIFQGINPNDIQSIEILKDASGTSLYGSAGSAGVVVVTTKRGTGGKGTFSYSGQFGYKDKPEFTYDMMTTKQLLKAQEDFGKVLDSDPANPYTGDALNTPGWFYSPFNNQNIGLTPAQLAANAYILDSMSKTSTDWNNIFLRRGSFSNNEISFRGGSGKTRLYSNIGLYKEEGTTLRSDMKRISWRNNFDYGDDKFSIAINSTIAYTRRNFQQSTTGNSLGNPFLVANVSTPYAPAYNADGSVATGTGNIFAAPNTLDLTLRDMNYSDQIKVLLSVAMSYKVAKNLTAAVTAGVDYRETQSTNYGDKRAYTRATSTSPTGSAGFLLEGLTRFLQPTIRPSLTWANTYNKHEITASVYGEYFHAYEKSLSSRGWGINPKMPNTPAAITQGNAANQLFAVVTGSKTERALSSGLFTASYTYNSKYTFSGSFRRDASSQLAPSGRSQNYMSAGLAWDMTKEKFLENSKVFNNLRFRASWGTAGNQNNFASLFGDFGYYGTWGYNGNGYSGIATTAPNVAARPDLKWEKTATTNVGIDYSMFKNRLYGDFNLYRRYTTDLTMFVRQSLSLAAGGPFTALDINDGQLENKGVEWNVNYELIKNRNLVLTLYTQGAYNKNTVLSLGSVTSFEQGTELVTVGLPLGSHYEVKWGGVDAATGAPLYYSVDGKLKTSRSDADRVQKYGTWESPWKGGWGSRLKYKNWDFNVFFSFQSGGNKVNNMEYFVENPVGFLANGYNQAASLNFWKKPGDIASTPSPKYGTNFSSKIIHDASFIRLKEISVYYTVPQKTLDKLKFIKSLKFFITGNNLYLWTKWIGMDPEAGAENINLSEFPNPKSATIGVNVSF